MFIRNKNYEKCIQRIKIEVGKIVGLSKDDEAFITLREIPTIDMLKLMNASNESDVKTLEFFRDILPSIIVDHNFYESEQEKMKPKSLASLIFESIELTQKILGDYLSASFFTQAQKNVAK